MAQATRAAQLEATVEQLERLLVMDVVEPPSVYAMVADLAQRVEKIERWVEAIAAQSVEGLRGELNVVQRGHDERASRLEFEENSSAIGALQMDVALLKWAVSRAMDLGQEVKVPEQDKFTVMGTTCYGLNATDLGGGCPSVSEEIAMGALRASALGAGTVGCEIPWGCLQGCSRVVGFATNCRVSRQVVPRKASRCPGMPVAGCLDREKQACGREKLAGERVLVQRSGKVVWHELVLFAGERLAGTRWAGIPRGYMVDCSRVADFVQRVRGSIGQLVPRKASRCRGMPVAGCLDREKQACGREKLAGERVLVQRSGKVVWHELVLFVWKRDRSEQAV
ncbi:OLC1v1015546C1 [Oldenlandia corymbosa var. corymbosa]|uniref:OLC1v1015546C1 n=1 Tax=Oldenlandia corymbosa var. corymbosa TaxID=529605 RepID=A0AAV1E6P9_OLDCO|nr:OLC1v1015546C1 [Oldenlandia corymbosa var. corymbosa]